MNARMALLLVLFDKKKPPIPGSRACHAQGETTMEKHRPRTELFLNNAGDVIEQKNDTKKSGRNKC